jgi:uncharacterized NAD(P)/FAD-binding protein YdhS
MRNFRIGIVGMGPRGLSIFERLASLLAIHQQNDVAVEIAIVEPDDLGPGVHRTSLPDYFLLNTICGLPTVFPNVSSAGVRGKSFYQWLLSEGRCHIKSDVGPNLSDEKISPQSYLPRRLMGEYLKDAFICILAQIPKSVRVSVHKARAENVLQDGCREKLICSGGLVLDCDVVVICTGHSEEIYRLPPAEDNKNELWNFVERPYDFLASPASSQIVSSENIAIEGFGLTAFDAIAALTIGRGGTFEGAQTESLTYKASGLEPTLYVYSRSGFPYRARPALDDGEFTHRPVVFRRDVIREIVNSNGSRPIDFLRQIEPLIFLELKVAYYSAIESCVNAMTASSSKFMRLPLSDFGLIKDWVAKKEEEFGRFDVSEFLEPRMHSLDAISYQEEVAAWMRSDLKEAKQTLKRSPIKIVAEVLLLLRENLRDVVEFGMLDAASHEYFFGRFASLVNRNAIGPQLERVEELLALVDAGVVEIKLGPDPVVEWNADKNCWLLTSRGFSSPSSVHASRWVLARARTPSANSGRSELISTLRRGGRIRSSAKELDSNAGVAIDRDFHAIAEDGVPQRRLFFLGPPCEGSTYYTTYIPTRIGISTPFVDAHCVATQTLKKIGIHALPLRSGRQMEASNEQ